jgi:hypothetical protein
MVDCSLIQRDIEVVKTNIATLTRAVQRIELQISEAHGALKMLVYVIGVVLILLGVTGWAYLGVR